MPEGATAPLPLSGVASGMTAAPRDGDAAPPRKAFTSFAEFWPFYLGEHLDPLNRALHVGGTAGGLLVAAASVATGWWWGLLVAAVLGYGLAWIGHFFVERNRPASFGNPLWSLRADLRLLRLTLTGRMRKEAERVGARCRF